MKQQQLSQFWYDDKTIDSLVKIAIETIGPEGKVALISCPTLYKKLKTEAGNDCEGIGYSICTNRVLKVLLQRLRAGRGHKNKHFFYMTKF